MFYCACSAFMTSSIICSNSMALLKYFVSLVSTKVTLPCQLSFCWSITFTMNVFCFFFLHSFPLLIHNLPFLLLYYTLHVYRYSFLWIFLFFYCKMIVSIECNVAPQFDIHLKSVLYYMFLSYISKVTRWLHISIIGGFL